MDFSAKLENLKAKIDEVVASARAAAAEDREQLKRQIGPSRTRPTPLTTPSGLSLTPNWLYSTHSTRGPTQTNGPRSPAARRSPICSPLIAAHP
jgi:hypothetical protein